jgi:hypothetical protein
MRARDIPTPETPEAASDEDYNSALRTVVLPVLGSLALAAVSLAILYAIFKHFKQKWKAKKSQLSPAQPSLAQDVSKFQRRQVLALPEVQ